MGAAAEKLRETGSSFWGVGRDDWNGFKCPGIYRARAPAA